jgi:hypothetical protein
VNAVGCSVHFLVHRFTADVLASSAAAASSWSGFACADGNGSNPEGCRLQLQEHAATAYPPTPESLIRHFDTAPRDRRA